MPVTNAVAHVAGVKVHTFGKVGKSKDVEPKESEKAKMGAKEGPDGKHVAKPGEATSAFGEGNLPGQGVNKGGTSMAQKLYGKKVGLKGKVEE